MNTSHMILFYYSSLIKWYSRKISVLTCATQQCHLNPRWKVESLCPRCLSMVPQVLYRWSYSRKKSLLVTPHYTQSKSLHRGLESHLTFLHSHLSTSLTSPPSTLPLALSAPASVASFLLIEHVMKVSSSSRYMYAWLGQTPHLFSGFAQIYLLDEAFPNHPI